jgi:hypothetical protein
VPSAGCLKFNSLLVANLHACRLADGSAGLAATFAQRPDLTAATF